jgi:ABC-type sugar transport system ATPase subunit
MAKIKVENISKFFRKKKVLDEVSFEAKDKSFTALLGSPGAGKTTLLRIIAGVEKPDSGRVLLDGEDVTNIPPQARGVAVVYQSFALYPHMKVYDNIANPLRAKKIDEDEIKKRVERVADLLKISGLLERRPKELSGGEAQRVATARAMVREAKAYLFDEPLTNLDYKIREDMRIELREMCKGLGSTIIYATPDPLDTLSMSEYVGVLIDGKLRQLGPSKEVYRKPADTEVASIFSFPPINLIECGSLRKDGEIYLQHKSILVNVTHMKQKIEPEKRYIVGLKPHHLKPFKEDAGVTFSADLFLTEVLGAETVCYLRLNDTILAAYVPYIRRIDTEQKIPVTFDPEDILVFDGDTKELLNRD